MATEEAVVFFTRDLENFRAYRVDSNTAWHIDRRAEHKTVEGAIGGRRAGTAGNRIPVQNAAGEGKGATVIDVIKTFQHQVNLRQNLVINALHELLGGHFSYPAEVTMSDCTDHRIDLADLLIHGPDTVDILDVRLHIAAASANLDDFVATRQGVNRRPAYGTVRSYDYYFILIWTLSV